MQTEFKFMKRMQKEKAKAAEAAEIAKAAEAVERAKAMEAAEKRRREKEALATQNFDRIEKYRIPSSVGYSYKINPDDFLHDYSITHDAPEDGGRAVAHRIDDPKTMRRFTNMEDAAAYIITLMKEDGVPI